MTLIDVERLESFFGCRATYEQKSLDSKPKFLLNILNDFIKTLSINRKICYLGRELAAQG